MVKAIVMKQLPLHLKRGCALFAFAPRRLRGCALGLGFFFLLFGEGTTQAVLDRHRGSMRPCVTMEEASTNRQIF